MFFIQNTNSIDNICHALQYILYAFRFIIPKNKGQIKSLNYGIHHEQCLTRRDKLTRWDISDNS